jgi:hypothetical protein
MEVGISISIRSVSIERVGDPWSCKEHKSERAPAVVVSVIVLGEDMIIMGGRGIMLRL